GRRAAFVDAARTGSAYRPSTTSSAAQGIHPLSNQVIVPGYDFTQFRNRIEHQEVHNRKIWHVSLTELFIGKWPRSKGSEFDSTGDESSWIVELKTANRVDVFLRTCRLAQGEHLVLKLE